jgi:cytochrome c peroxidase
MTKRRRFGLLVVAGASVVLVGACGESHVGEGDRELAAEHAPSEADTGRPLAPEAAPTPPPVAPGEGSAMEAVRTRARQVLGALPPEAPRPDTPITQEQIRLGRMLYYDARLSKNHDVSCNTCHLLDQFGVDQLPTSVGHRDQRGNRNAPTVYNAALHVAQFWDGRAADVEEQAKGPILNPVEMALPSEEAAVKVLRSIPGYAALFRAGFPSDEAPITYDNMARAIGAFERRLMTPSPFDAFLEGRDDALSIEALIGFETFVGTGCPTCHMGPLVGGSMFQKLGLVEDYPTEDLGRFAVTNNEVDRKVFKVPSLRNVTETAPYFHDGSIETVEKAIRLMGRHQLARTLSNDEIATIVAFLRSLVGTIDPEYIRQPQLPPSGPDTPVPDPT